MNNVVIRDARQDDAGTIVQMIRRMVTDMASHGGHATATDDAAWEKMTVAIAEQLEGSARYVIAQSADGGPVGVAGAGRSPSAARLQRAGHGTSALSMSCRSSGAAASAAG
jgi:hypothetical protein